MLWSLLWCLLVSTLITQVAVFSTTIYLHRCATHKALELHPAAAFAFRLALWITSGLSTREWVAVHRKHHAFTEVEGDPPAPAAHDGKAHRGVVHRNAAAVEGIGDSPSGLFIGFEARHLGGGRRGIHWFAGCIPTFARNSQWDA